MRPRRIFFAFILVLHNVSAQYVEIPDSNFRKVLKSSFFSCFDSQDRLDTTCADILTVSSFGDFFNKDIESIEGIMYFKSLTSLPIGSNKIKHIKSLPPNLEYFSCPENQLTELPPLPSKLRFLFCQKNLLKSLPALPEGLTSLNCEYNKILELPNLPSSLYILDCGHNLLTSLPKLPENLDELYCGHNNLTKLPPLPKFLSNLGCDSNKIIELQDFGGYSLSCRDNLISELPYIQPIYHLDCRNNHNLKCLPVLNKEIRTLRFEGTQINCAPNYLERFSIPVCDPTNNSQFCDPFSYVKGKVFIDSNRNGILDGNEVGMSNVKIGFKDRVYTFTDEEGHYKISPGGLGMFLLSINIPKYYASDSTSLQVNFLKYKDVIHKDIAIYASEDSTDFLLHGMSDRTPPRPGFTISYDMTIQNTGTETASPTLFFSYDTKLLSVDSISVPGTLNPSEIQVSLSQIAPGISKKVKVYGRVSTEATLGEFLKVDLALHANQKDYKSTLQHMIRGSFDPNDIAATPTIDIHEAKADKGYIDYTIRFQNTGTDTAFHVTIKDTLPYFYVDHGSLRILSASHPYKVDLNHHMLNFSFPNILLPDSNTHEKASHGYISFRINTMPYVQLSDTIKNRASIYFDFNKAVHTNTATTHFTDSIVSSVSFSKVQLPHAVFPNPALEEIIVDGKGTFSIMDLSGKILQTHSVNGTHFIDIRQLNSGIYLYRLNHEFGKIKIQ